MDKCLLVGINDYLGAPLSGCVNDVTDMAEFLTDHASFKPDSIRLLTDKRATTAGILERLAWLVDVPAKSRVVFHFSGHGVQLPARNDKGEVDSLDEAICPQNFDWGDEHVIRDDDFAKIFAKLPKDVTFLWVSDSCHSGDLTRDLVQNPHAPKSKSMVPPADIAWRFRSIAQKQIATPRATRAAAGKDVPLPGVFISGCKSNQTSADAYFQNRPNGALTHYLLKTLGSPQGLHYSMTDIIRGVRSGLKQGGYSQVPQLEGKKAAFAKSFLG